MDSSSGSLVTNADTTTAPNGDKDFEPGEYTDRVGADVLVADPLLIVILLSLLYELGGTEMLAAGTMMDNLEFLDGTWRVSVAGLGASG